jgi:hypothetical protein
MGNCRQKSKCCEAHHGGSVLFGSLAASFLLLALTNTA